MSTRTLIPLPIPSRALLTRPLIPILLLILTPLLSWQSRPLLPTPRRPQSPPLIQRQPQNRKQRRHPC